MIKHSKFPSIEQFRTVVKRVSEKHRFAGLDEDGCAVFDYTKPLPVLTFTGTTKLHGTNAGIGYNSDNLEYWCQSRERILSRESDNAGFYAFVHSDYYKLNDMFDDVHEAICDSGMYSLDNYRDIVIYGEWCGAGIQKGVAINQMDKMFVVFGIKLVSTLDGYSVWLPDNMVQDIIGHDEDARIFNIFTFGSQQIEIDFNTPELIQNQLIEYTDAVEKCCPVGKYFGVNGVGEGIVWKCVTEPFTGSDYMFKVKGQKHSESRVKRLASMDLEKINSIAEFVDSAVTENRLQHGLEHLKEQCLDVSIQNTGAFLKWVVNDVLKEETDTIEGNGLVVKEVCQAMSKKAKTWYFQQLRFQL